MKSMLSDIKLVEENYRVEDLLNFDAYVQQLADVVESTSNVALIGVIGAYGTGKSVMLEKYKAQAVKQGEKWIHIDAWKYPDRRDLWEGFVLDFAAQLKPKLFKKALKNIDGESKGAIETIVKTIAVGMNAVVPLSGNVTEKLTYFTKSSPAKRIFQVQDIFKGLLKNVEKTIYIVVEDADRSGPAGIYFIETLNQFLKDLEVDNKIKVFIPIAKSTFEETPDPFFKALDYVEFFEFGKRDFENFVEKVFHPGLIAVPTVKDNIIEIVQRLVNRKNITIRQLKLIIRNSEAKYKALQKQGFSPDPRIMLLMQASRFYYEEQFSVRKIAHTMFSTKGSTEGSSFNNNLLYAIVRKITVGEAVNEINLQRPKPADLVCHFVAEEQLDGISKTAIPFYKDGKQYLPGYYLM